MINLILYDYYKLNDHPRVPKQNSAYCHLIIKFITAFQCSLLCLSHNLVYLVYLFPIWDRS